jgi:hypothetical protein
MSGDLRVDQLSDKVGDINNYEQKFKTQEKAASTVESFYNIATVTAPHA